MKIVRFIPAVLGAILLALAAACSWGSVSCPVWAPGCSTLSTVALVALEAIALVLAVGFGKWHEHATYKLPYEVASMFVGMFFLAFTVALVPAVLQSAPGTDSTGSAGGTPSPAASSVVDDAEQYSALQDEAYTNYMDSPQFRMLSLSEFERYFNAASEEAAQQAVVYIGRAGCGGCSSFAQVASQRLTQEGLTMLAYYTSESAAEDRDKQEELLDRIQVNAVPVVLVVADGKVQQRIGGLAEHMDEIVHLLKESPVVTPGSTSDVSATSSDERSENPSSSNGTAEHGAPGQCDDDTGDCSAL